MGSKVKINFFATKKRPIETIDKDLLQHLFPQELTTYFSIVHHQIVCTIASKEEYWLIDFEENNDLPNGYPAEEYESKGFMESKLIQDFPLRGKAVFLRIKRRRWRHKGTGKIIKRDFSFVADGSKFTQELSDFLKDTGQYAT